MCGIVGMAGAITFKEEKMFKDMLILSQLRGFDSTGVLAVNRLNATHIEKVLGVPTNLWEKPNSLFSSADTILGKNKILLGHNRAATAGAKTIENAHPFEFGHIIGVHNGSLTYYTDLVGHKEHDVDSKAIFNTISEKGIEETWKGFYGAATLVYWDKKEAELNIIRNDQRPLVIATSEDGNTMFWASEEWMILVAASRNKVPLKKHENGKILVSIPAEHKLHTYEVGVSSFKLKEVRELEKKVYTPPPQTYTYTQTNHGYSGHYKGGSGGSEPVDFVINKDWASDCVPGDKILRGQTFKFISLAETYKYNMDTKRREKSFYMIGRMDDGTRIEIYPAQYKEYYKWSLLEGELVHKDIFFRMTARPRLRKWEYSKVYRISTQQVIKSSEVAKHFVNKSAASSSLPVEIPVYQLYNKRATRTDWLAKVNNLVSKGCCTCCNNPLSIELHKSYMWVNANVVLCETCKEDPTIVDYVRQYNVN